MFLNIIVKILFYICKNIKFYFWLRNKNYFFVLIFSEEVFVIRILVIRLNDFIMYRSNFVGECKEIKKWI